MKKLTPKQSEALKWLVANKGRWTEAWWGGRPYSGWPKQMPAQTYNSLSLAGLIMTTVGERFDRNVYITGDGRKALGAQS